MGSDTPRGTSITSSYRLSKDILAVAVAHPEAKDWAAYIGVETEDREDRIINKGTKLPQSVAIVLFPFFSTEFRWRP